MPPTASAPDASKLTPERKAELEASIRAQVGCEKATYDMQWRLLDGVAPLALMEEAAEVLNPSHYADVVTERAIDGRCGYPCCGQPLPVRDKPPPKLHISLAHRKIYDVSALANFCAQPCAARSHAYAQTLSSASLYLRKGRAPDSGGSPPVSTAGAAPPSAAASSAPGPVDAPPATAAASSSSVPPAGCGSAAAVGSIVERPHAEPNLVFSAPAAPGLIDGYAPAGGRLAPGQAASGHSSGDMGRGRTVSDLADLPLPDRSGNVC